MNDNIFLQFNTTSIDLPLEINNDHDAPNPFEHVAGIENLVIENYTDEIHVYYAAQYNAIENLRKHVREYHANDATMIDLLREMSEELIVAHYDVDDPNE